MKLFSINNENFKVVLISFIVFSLSGILWLNFQNDIRFSDFIYSDSFFSKNFVLIYFTTYYLIVSIEWVIGSISFNVFIEKYIKFVILLLILGKLYFLTIIAPIIIFPLCIFFLITLAIYFLIISIMLFFNKFSNRSKSKSISFCLFNDLFWLIIFFCFLYLMYKVIGLQYDVIIIFITTLSLKLTFFYKFKESIADNFSIIKKAILSLSIFVISIGIILIICNNSQEVKFIDKNKYFENSIVNNSDSIVRNLFVSTASGVCEIRGNALKQGYLVIEGINLQNEKHIMPDKKLVINFNDSVHFNQDRMFEFTLNFFKNYDKNVDALIKIWFFTEQPNNEYLIYSRKHKVKLYGDF